MILTLLQVALGGAIGASARYLVNSTMMRLLGPSLPWSTLLVNVVGSLLMGVMVVVLAHKGDMRFAPFLMTGVLGGFTTFSAFSLDVMTLWERGEGGVAAAYIVGSVVLSLLGIFAGMALARGALA